MSILKKLSSQLGKKNNDDNIKVAKELSESKNAEEIKELVDNLDNKDKRIQSDCIKVLYEIGYINPGLIANYVNDFLTIITHKNNRLIWGGMIALSTIASLKPDEIFKSIELIKKIINAGSVITIDAGIKIISTLASVSQKYKNELMDYLLNHLETYPVKYIPMHSEIIYCSIDKNNKTKFLEVLNLRINGLSGSSLLRLKKIIKKIEAI